MGELGLMRYEYRCTECGGLSYTHDRADRIETLCCLSEGRRVFGFAFNKPMPAHYNHSIGKYVTNERGFLDGLKSQSEAIEARTGVPTNLVPIDVSDRKACGVTDDGIEALAEDKARSSVAP